MVVKGGKEGIWEKQHDLKSFTNGRCPGHVHEGNDRDHNKGSYGSSEGGSELSPETSLDVFLLNYLMVLEGNNVHQMFCLTKIKTNYVIK